MMALAGLEEEERDKLAPLFPSASKAEHQTS
jgi:hypothetical protein